GRKGHDAIAIERFRREAQTAAQVDSDHVVKVFEAGRIEGLPFISMEYVDGAPASDIMRGGLIAPKVAAAITLAAARGLAAAHDHGIVHRDVKPGNILVCRDGRVKVSDFGLAKFRETETTPAAADVTQPGMIVGTPAYMAPEQADAKDVDGRADVYALGI